ncbi:MAG: RND transporter [Desulfobulbaceae bacterium]|nr:RND transporter [Desulfobulbaceae bacterium]
MFKFLDKITYAPLVVAAIFMGLAPFTPMPHVIEKFTMIAAGQLTRPIDIFDLLFHLSPTILLLIKLGRTRSGSPE